MGRVSFLIGISLFAIGVISYNRGTDTQTDTLLIPGKCKKLWRNDELKGRCFGLEIHSNHKQLKDTSLNITAAIQCRALCCNLGAGNPYTRQLTFQCNNI